MDPAVTQLLATAWETSLESWQSLVQEFLLDAGHASALIDHIFVLLSEIETTEPLLAGAWTPAATVTMLLSCLTAAVVPLSNQQLHLLCEICEVSTHPDLYFPFLPLFSMPAADTEGPSYPASFSRTATATRPPASAPPSEPEHFDRVNLIYTTLIRLLRQHQHLSVPILLALSQLPLHIDLKKTIFDGALQQFAIVEEDRLPQLLRATCDCLDLTADWSISGFSQLIKAISGLPSERLAPSTLESLLEVIRCIWGVAPAFARGWLDFLSHQKPFLGPLDLFVLLHLLEDFQFRGAATATAYRLVSRGSLPVTRICGSLERFPSLAKPLVPSLLLLCSAGPRRAPRGHSSFLISPMHLFEVYATMYRLFPDLSGLLIHRSLCIDPSLVLLRALFLVDAEHQLHEIVHNAGAIEELLYQLLDLEVPSSTITRLAAILGPLAIQSASLQHSLEIFIRKNIFAGNTRILLALCVRFISLFPGSIPPLGDWILQLHTTARALATQTAVAHFFSAATLGEEVQATYRSQLLKYLRQDLSLVTISESAQYCDACFANALPRNPPSIARDSWLGELADFLPAAFAYLLHSSTHPTRLWHVLGRRLLEAASNSHRSDDIRSNRSEAPTASGNEIVRSLSQNLELTIFAIGAAALLGLGCSLVPMAALTELLTFLADSEGSEEGPPSLLPGLPPSCLLMLLSSRMSSAAAAGSDLVGELRIERWLLWELWTGTLVAALGYRQQDLRRPWSVASIAADPFGEFDGSLRAAWMLLSAGTTPFLAAAVTRTAQLANLLKQQLELDAYPPTRTIVMINSLLSVYYRLLADAVLVSRILGDCPPMPGLTASLVAEQLLPSGDMITALSLLELVAVLAPDQPHLVQRLQAATLKFRFSDLPKSRFDAPLEIHHGVHQLPGPQQPRYAPMMSSAATPVQRRRIFLTYLLGGLWHSTAGRQRTQFLRELSSDVERGPTAPDSALINADTLAVGSEVLLSCLIDLLNTTASSSMIEAGAGLDLWSLTVAKLPPAVAVTWGCSLFTVLSRMLPPLFEYFFSPQCREEQSQVEQFHRSATALVSQYQTLMAITKQAHAQAERPDKVIGQYLPKLKMRVIAFSSLLDRLSLAYSIASSSVMRSQQSSAGSVHEEAAVAEEDEGSAAGSEQEEEEELASSDSDLSSTEDDLAFIAQNFFRRTAPTTPPTRLSAEMSSNGTTHIIWQEE